MTAPTTGIDKIAEIKAISEAKAALEAEGLSEEHVRKLLGVMAQMGVAPARIFYSRREVAEILGLSLSTVDKLIREGQLPSVKEHGTGGRHGKGTAPRLVSWANLAKFLATYPGREKWVADAYSKRQTEQWEKNREKLEAAARARGQERKNLPLEGTTAKRCRACAKIRPIAEFSKVGRRWSPRCKQCEARSGTRPFRDVRLVGMSWGFSVIERRPEWRKPHVLWDIGDVSLDDAKAALASKGWLLGGKAKDPGQQRDRSIDRLEWWVIP